MADILLSLGIDDSIKPAAAKSGKEAGDRFAKEFDSSVGRGFKKLALTAAGVGATIAGALFSRASIRAAIEQEDAVNRLNSALFQNGEFSQRASQDLQNFASELQATTRFGDEAVIAQLAYSKSLGVSTEQSKALIEASANLSAALGISLETANRNLVKSLSGLAGELGELVPGLRDLTAEQLKAGGAVDLVGQKFAGFAERDVQTFSGRIQQAQNSFDGLLKTIGFLVTQNPAVIKAIGILSQGFQELNKLIVDNSKIFKSLVADVFVGVVSAAEFVANGINSIAQAFVRLQGFGRDIEISASLKALNLELVDAINLSGQYANESRQTGNVAAESIQQQIDLLKQERDEQALNNQTRIDGLTGLSDKISEIASGLKTAFASEDSTDIFSKLGDQAESAADRVANALTNSTESTEKTKQQINAITSALTSGISQSLQTLGASLVKGENFFKGFIGIAINALGDLLIAFGTGAITVGAVAEGIRNSIIGLFGGQAIVAGLASIVAGGALKAFAGSLGAAGSGGPTVASDTGTSTGGVISPSADFAQPEQEERRADQSVQIVVQGDILDSEETGTRILKLISDNFKTSNSALIEGRFA